MEEGIKVSFLWQYYYAIFVAELVLEVLYTVNVLYVILCKHLGLSSTWYETALCFPLGVFIYNYRKLICQTYKKTTKWFICLFLAIVFSILFVVSLLVSENYHIIFKICSSAFFAFQVIYISNLVSVEN